MSLMEPLTRMKVETLTAGVLVATPWWVDALQNVNIVASAIAAVCAAIYGVYTVVRMVHIHREKKRWERTNHE